MRVWLGSGAALGRTLPPRGPGRVAVLAWAASGLSGAARPPPLKRAARPPRAARAECEGESLRCRAEAGTPSRVSSVFKCARRRPRPGRPPGGPALPSGGWRLGPRRRRNFCGERSPRALVVGRNSPQSGGEGRVALPRRFVESSGGSGAAAASPFVLLGPPSFAVSLPLSAGGSRWPRRGALGDSLSPHLRGRPCSLPPA